MGPERNTALWLVVGLAAGLFAAQTALADADFLTLRLLLNLAATIEAIGVVVRLGGRSWRALTGPPPEPISLVLAGLAALCLWAPAWWLMDWANSRLEIAVGVLDRPTPITALNDTLLGVDLGSVTYELEILLAVVALPLASAGLLWGLLQPELARIMGRWRAAWLAGTLAGAFLALSAVQDVAPALPWGLAALGGYLLIGWVASLAVYLTGSPWAGFSALATFAYATFAWRDDLFREFADKDYLDPAWLTVLALGGFGALVVLQVLRFRVPCPAESEPRAPDGWVAICLPVAVILAALTVLVALEIAAR